MPFVKGKSGNPAGKPQGTKNKNCMRPVFWWNLLEECLVETNGDKKIGYIFRALDLLMPKVPVLPATPEDSVSNAQKTIEVMNGLAPVDAPLEPEVQALPEPPTNGNGDQNGHG